MGPCLGPTVAPQPDLGACLNVIQPCLDFGPCLEIAPSEPVVAPIEVGPCLEAMPCLDVGPCLKVAPPRRPKRGGKKDDGAYWHAPARADVVAKLIEHAVLPADVLDRLDDEDA